VRRYDLVDNNSQKSTLLRSALRDSNVAQYRPEHAFVPTAPHRHAQQRADKHLVFAVIELLAFACSFARDLVLLPAVDLALIISEVRPSVAGTAEESPHRSSFGFAGEARRVGH